MSTQTIKELNEELNGKALAAIAEDRRREVAEDNQYLQDKLAEYLSKRDKTLYVGTREDENREWVHFVRDKTLPEYDGHKAIPTTGGIIAEGPSEAEMDALKFRIMANDVLEIINQEAAS